MNVRWSRRVVLFVCTGQLACGSIAPTGDDGSVTDDGGVRGDAGTDATNPTDAGPPCTLFEPNDDFSSSAILVAGTVGPVGICPGNDRDFYRFVVTGNEDVTIDILYDNMAGQGNLGLRLLNGAGTMIDQSQTPGNNEQISTSVALGNRLAADSYTFEVYGVLGTTQNNYTIQLAIIPSPDVAETLTAVSALNYGADWGDTLFWRAEGTPGDYVTKWNKRTDCAVGAYANYYRSPGETCLVLVDDGSGTGVREASASNIAQILSCDDYLLGEWTQFATFYSSDADCQASVNGRNTATATTVYYDSLSTGCPAPGVMTAASAGSYDFNCQ